MIHEILLVLAGFQSSIIKQTSDDNSPYDEDDTASMNGLEDDEDSDARALLHPAERQLLDHVARFGARHRSLIEAVQEFDYSPSFNTDISIEGDQELPTSYVIVRSATVTAIRAHVLQALATHLQKTEAEILHKDSRYVGGEKTVSVAQIVGEILFRWDRVLRYALLVLRVFRIPSSLPASTNQLALNEFGLPIGSIYTESNGFQNDDSNNAQEHTLPRNVFALFSQTVGYPEVDTIRKKCLLAAHRVWLQMAVSWLLYGHTSTTGSLVSKYQPSTQNSQTKERQRALIEHLLVNQSKSKGDFQDGREEDSQSKAGDEKNWVNGTFKSLFLPPGIGPDLGHSIYSTGTMVNQFLGSSAMMGPIPSKFSTSISVSSSVVSLASHNNPYFHGISSASELHAATTTVAELSSPINIAELRFAVQNLRRAILKTLGAGQFRASRVYRYFWTLRMVALAGDAEFCTELGEQVLAIKNEGKARALAGGALSLHGKTYEDDEDLSDVEIEQDKRTNSTVTAATIIKRLVPEALRRALLNVAEHLDDETDDEIDKKIQMLHSHHRTQPYSVRNKQMYQDAAKFILLSSPESNFQEQPQDPALGSDIFTSTLLDIPARLELRLSWFQTVLTRSPELDGSKYSVLFSFLISLCSVQQQMSEQWRNTMFWRGSTYRKRLNECPQLQQQLLEELDMLLYSVHHARVFVTAIWEYFQVTIIDQQFMKLLAKCFPRRENVSMSSEFKYGGGEDDGSDPFVDPDTIAGLHQEFISTVYDMIFLDNDQFSKLFLDLIMTIKTSCSWLLHSHATLILATQAVDITETEEAELQKAGYSMNKLSKGLHGVMELIYDQVENIQQTDDDVATKNPLHQLLLRIEFVRERKNSDYQHQTNRE